MQVEIKNKTSKEDKDKLEAAKRDFDKIMQEIKPFIKRKKLAVIEPTRQWRTSEIEEHQ